MTPLQQVVTCALLCSAAFVHALAEPALNVQASWIGNTSGFGDGAWMHINITALAVSPDGKVYTNAPWDESGAEASAYQNGKMLGFAGGTHGWGNSGGNPIAINKRYANVAVGVGNEKGHLTGQGVWPDKGCQWYGISRREIGDTKRVAAFQAAVSSIDPHAKAAAAFAMVNDVPTGTRGDINGLPASDTTLYASNTSQNRVEVYDTESMQRKAQWGVPAPCRIARAGDGTLWVLTDALGDKPKVALLNANGQRLKDELPLRLTRSPSKNTRAARC